MSSSIRKSGGGAFSGLAEELHREYRAQPRPTAPPVEEEFVPYIERDLVPSYLDLNDPTIPVVIGRHILSLSPAITDESLLGFAQMKPFIYPVEHPSVSLIASKQTYHTRSKFIDSAKRFVYDHPTANEELEATGYLKIFTPPARSQFTTVRLIVEKQTDAHATVLEERNQLHAAHARPRIAPNSLTAILCSLNTPSELVPMLAERIEEVPLTFTLGAISMGAAYRPPRVPLLK